MSSLNPPTLYDQIASELQDLADASYRQSQRFLGGRRQLKRLHRIWRQVADGAPRPTADAFLQLAAEVAEPNSRLGRLADAFSAAIRRTASSEPASSEPVSSEPASSEPVSSEPVSSEPVSRAPAVGVAAAPVGQQVWIGRPTAPLNPVDTQTLAELARKQGFVEAHLCWICLESASEPEFALFVVGQGGDEDAAAALGDDVAAVEDRLDSLQNRSICVCGVAAEDGFAEAVRRTGCRIV